MQRRETVRAALALLVWGASSAVGCAGGPDERSAGLDEGPGTKAWAEEADVTCESDTDCATGEACEEGVCQMARCMDSYSSTPPLGTSHLFGTEGEVAVLSDQTWLDAFDGDGSYLSSRDLSNGGGPLTAVASGNLTGEGPPRLAVAHAGQPTVQLVTTVGAESFAMGLSPIALATGDVDGDGVEELVGLSAGGELAVCDVAEDHCRHFGLEGATGQDMAMADVDGDGFPEAMLAVTLNGERLLIAWNVDAERTGQDEILAWELGMALTSLGAGDLDGDGVAEVVLLEDGGYWGWAKDRLHVFSLGTEQVLSSTEVDSGAMDVAVGDRDADGTDDVVLLRDDHQLELFRADASGLDAQGTWPVTVGEEPSAIAVVDWDGDSPSGRLVLGPELVAGDAVPLAALMFPPYPEGYAAGKLGAGVNLGEGSSVTESESDTISLSVGMGVSFGAEALGFKAKVGASLKKSVKISETLTTSLSIGARYSARADTALFGYAYAPVVMSCGCYHRYRYETHDPKGLLGGDGQTVDIFVPVGGQTQLWSSPRYNAMAEATGKLPAIEIPIRVGDPDSYPTEPTTLAGAPVAANDLVFTETPSYQASDVGYVEFWLKKGETQTNSVAESVTLGVNASFGALGASIDTSASVGVSQGYSLKVGKEGLFSGSIPPIPDDPDTPEDEFDVHRFAFSPYVYREHYRTPAGGDAAFYVMNYTVQR